MAPTNDNFADSIVLTGSSFNVTGTNVGATGEPGEPNHAGVNFGIPEYVDSVWWSWTAPTSGEVVINTFGSNYDTSLGVYTGSAVNSLTTIAGNDDTFGLQSQVTFTAVAGTTYRIAVDGYSNRTGSFTLDLGYSLIGTAGNDTLNGDSTSDTIYGRGGNDQINGNGGYDFLYGEDGNDQINGGSLIDRIFGGSGDDRINGNGGNDRIYGGSGSDTITGGPGNASIYGEDGNDTIYSNGGGGSLYGGAGDDTINGSSQYESIDGGDGNDIIYGNGGGDYISGGAGDDIIYGNGGTLSGDSGNDTIYGSSQYETIYGGDGNDIIYGNGGGDYIYSGSGVDTLWLGSGNATVFLQSGDGFDTINNFQLNQTTFRLEFGITYDNLTFSDSTDGAQISYGSDLLAVVSNTQASTFTNNPDVFI